MNYSRNKLFLLSSVGIIFGTFFGNLIKDYNYLMFVVLFLLAIFLGISYFYRLNKLYIISPLMTFLLFLGYSSYNLDKNLNKEQIIEKVTQNYELRGEYKIKLLYKAKTTPYGEKYIGELLSYNNKNLIGTYKLNVFTPGEYNYERGTLISGKTKIKPHFDKLGNSYKYYNFSKGIYGDVYLYTFKIDGTEKLNFVQQKINDLRKFVLEGIFSLFPRQEGNLLGGILIGARENLGKELENNFNASGLTHIIAVSGYNITIIIIFFGLIFGFLPPIARFILISSIIIFFTLLVGDSPAVIRASIMGGIGYFVLLLGRDNNLISTLLLSLVIMIVYQPLSLNYDISLQLSFLAVVGLIYLKPIFDILLTKLGKNIITESIALTLSATIFTLPVIIINFSYFSVVSPLTNLLIGGLLPFAMLFGFLSILSIKCQLLSYILGYFSWLILHYIIGIINYFGSLKYSTVDFALGNKSYIISLFYFIFIITFLIFFNKKKKD